MVDTADGLIEVHYADIEGVAVVEGDILVDGLGSRRSAVVANAGWLWPYCTVPYSLDSSVTADVEATILDAIAHWEANSPLVFVEDPSAVARVVFQQPESGCSSYVGRTGFAQPLNLSAGCGFGSAVHEVGHSLGVFHTQSRSDRDQYVEVRLQNVEEGCEHNFAAGMGMDLPVPYSVESVMHYGSGYFMAPGLGLVCSPNDTSGCPLVTVEGDYIAAQRSGLAQIDIVSVDLLYTHTCGGDEDGGGQYLPDGGDDGDAAVHPGAAEVCNGVDDDCDALVDEGLTVRSYLDADGDSYGDAATPVDACGVPAGYVLDSTDCDDSRADVFPGAPELCDGVDQDCDGVVDGGCDDNSDVSRPPPAGTDPAPWNCSTATGRGGTGSGAGVFPAWLALGLVFVQVMARHRNGPVALRRREPGAPVFFVSEGF